MRPGLIAALIASVVGCSSGSGAKNTDGSASGDGAAGDKASASDAAVISDATGDAAPGDSATATDGSAAADGSSAACNVGPVKDAFTANGGIHAAFSNLVGTDVTASPYDADILSSTAGMSGSGILTWNFVGVISGGNMGSVQLMLLGKPTTGRMYHVTNPESNDGDAVVGYSHSVPVGSAYWGATGGSFVVDSVVGKTVHITVCGATMANRGIDPANKATGTFTMDVKARIDNVNGL